jgi:Cu2+-exporting ATPase
MKPRSSAHDHHQHGTHLPAASAGHAEDGGHDRHVGHSVETFRDKFWITLVLSIPTLV